VVFIYIFILDTVNERKITIADFFDTCKTFTTEEIGSDDYIYEVRKVIIRKFDYGERYKSDLTMRKLYLEWERHGGENSTWPNPKIDAIGLIVGLTRKCFNVHKLHHQFPSLIHTINNIKQTIKK